MIVLCLFLSIENIWLQIIPNNARVFWLFDGLFDCHSAAALQQSKKRNWNANDPWTCELRKGWITPSVIHKLFDILDEVSFNNYFTCLIFYWGIFEDYLIMNHYHVSCKANVALLHCFCWEWGWQTCPTASRASKQHELKDRVVSTS